MTRKDTLEIVRPTCSGDPSRSAGGPGGRESGDEPDEVESTNAGTTHADGYRDPTPAGPVSPMRKVRLATFTFNALAMAAVGCGT